MHPSFCWQSIHSISKAFIQRARHSFYEQGIHSMSEAINLRARHSFYEHGIHFTTGKWSRSPGSILGLVCCIGFMTHYGWRLWASLAGSRDFCAPSWEAFSGLSVASFSCLVLVLSQMQNTHTKTKTNEHSQKQKHESAKMDYRCA